MARTTDFRQGRRVVYALHAHLVFTPKYRRAVITPRVLAELENSMRRVCADFETTLDEINVEQDHIHLLISYPPKVSLSKLVNSLKDVSSRHIRQLDYPEVQQALWGSHFWSPLYYVISCGGAPLEAIKRYIQNQNTPA